MQKLVVGGTGIVGGYIVEHLVRAGERPVALSRSAHRSPIVDWVQGDLTAPTALDLPPIDTVFCTAEVGLLADALPAIFQPTLRRVVAFTSTSIVTKIQSEIPHERALLQRLADGEQRLIAACEKQGVGWTILRPTIIYAEGRDGNLTRLARLIERFGLLPVVGEAKGLRQPVHAEDLAVGAIQAASSANAIKKTYSLPGGEIITYREMVGRVFDSLDRPRRILSMPPQVWRAAFFLVKPFLPNANVAMGLRMEKDMVFDATPACRDFGWNPRKFSPRFQ